MSSSLVGDNQFEGVTIASVSDSGRYWVLHRSDGFEFLLDKSHGVQPDAGSRARFYGRGIGSPVRGLEIDGRVAFYETEDEYRARLDREHRRKDRRRRRRAMLPWVAARRVMRRAALPRCFRARLRRFQRHNRDFWWRDEGYEMSACVDAVKIARACGSPEAVAAFASLDPQEQRQRVPDFDPGHSGNTFAMAVRLASHFLVDERLVLAEHAAIALLIGCDDAGCPPITDAEFRIEGYFPWRPEEESA